MIFLKQSSKQFFSTAMGSSTPQGALKAPPWFGSHFLSSLISKPFPLMGRGSLTYRCRAQALKSDCLSLNLGSVTSWVICASVFPSAKWRQYYSLKIKWGNICKVYGTVPGPTLVTISWTSHPKFLWTWCFFPVSVHLPQTPFLILFARQSPHCSNATQEPQLVRTTLSFQIRYQLLLQIFSGLEEV